MGFLKRGLRRGAVGPYFLISLVLAIIGFLIVLYFIFGFDFANYASDEVCKLSVLTRATTPAAAQNFVPLKCTTKKICLTQELFGECEQFAGEEEVVRVRLPADSENAAREIEKVSANAMYDCWKMMGEGKLDLFGNFWKQLGVDENSGSSSCVICSRVAVDKNIDENVLEIIDINKYIEENKVPGQAVTYLQAFTDRGTNSFARVSDINELRQGIEKEREDLGRELKSVEQKRGLEMAFVFMQIKTVGYNEVLGNLAKLGIAFGGGAFMTPVIGKYFFNPYAIGGALVVAAGAAGYSALNVRAEHLAAAGYCGEFVSSEGEGKKGCSLVQGVPYDRSYINKLCGNIQGSP